MQLHRLKVYDSEKPRINPAPAARVFELSIATSAMIVLVVACALAGPWTRPALRPAPLAPVRSRGLQPRGSTLDVPTRGPPSAEGEGEGDRLASDEPGSTAASLALQGVRWAPLAVGVGYLIHPSTLDDAVARVWSALSSLDVVRQPMFEAEVAAGSFWVWIVLFLSLHVLMGPKAAAHRFDQRMPHDPWSFTRVENWPEWAYPFFTYLGSIQLCARRRAPLQRRITLRA